MLKIEINNNRGLLNCNLKTLLKVREHLKLKHPNAYYLRVNGHVPKGWDGCLHYITESGVFDIGMLPMIVEYLDSRKLDITWVDNRNFKFDIKLSPYLPGGQQLRSYQMEAIEAVLSNKLARRNKLLFPQGILFAATNAGKTMIAAGIHNSVRFKGRSPRTVLLLNQSDLFHDACRDIPKILGDSEVGYMQGNRIKWGNFMICMVPTLRSRLNVLGDKMSSYDIVIFDECDTAAAKTNLRVVKTFYNAAIRVGMSGSVGVGGKSRTKVKDRAVNRLFGDIVYTIKNSELIDMGVSSQVDIQIHAGSMRPGIKGDYREEYSNSIIRNKQRNNSILERVKHHIEEGNTPMLVITPRHKHIRILYRRIKELVGDKYRVEMVYHTTKERKEIQLRFANGEIDILVGSYILKRGKNFPLMKALINAGSGDSSSNVLQILGRALRSHKSKSLTYVDDFWDTGEYLRRHSLHRYQVYKKENLPLKIMFNKKLLTHKTI